MKNKLKIFMLVAGVIAVSAAIVCFIVNNAGDKSDEDPMFI